MSGPFELTGTRQEEQTPLHLVAGRLSADFVDGALRTIRHDGVEVIRAISYLVRDRDWGTHAPDITGLAVTERPDGFTLAYRAAYTGPDATTLDLDIRIEADGQRLGMEVTALSPTGFETNRCGFCVLHPIIGVAGGPVTVEHVDGSRVETTFPDLIEPWQPFMNMRAITHRVREGVTAKCLMEGDTFEMEDQRNWSDASFKTYVRPLALPWPYHIEAGRPHVQRITLTLHEQPGLASPQVQAGNAGEPVRLEPRGDAVAMPRIGLLITPEEARSALAEKAVLDDIAPQMLLFHIDPLAGHGERAMETFAELARLHGGETTLEIALPCVGSPAQECEALAGQLERAGLAPQAIMISPAVDRQSTPPGSAWPDCPPLDEVYAAAREAFPGVQLVGGMLSYFTELNRKRVPSERLDFISHCTNPIVHAADDLSVMQTLEALPFITRSVRAIYGDKPYRIGPSTIAMRQNPYGSRTMDNPGLARIPMANRDPRHNGRFGDAFALGYAASVLDAGLSHLTLCALTGPSGLIAGENEPSPAGTLRPLARTIRLLASLAGTMSLPLEPSHQGRVAGLVVRTAGGREVLVANLTASEQRIDLSALDGASGSAKPLAERLAPYETRSITLP